MHDVKYSGDKGALALSIRDTWRLHNLASISVSDPGTSYSSAGGAAGGIASKEANKLVVMNFDEQRTTLKSISVTGPRGSSGTQFLLTSGDEHLKIIWFLRFLNSKYLLRDIELTGVENAELEQWYRTNVQLVHETFESSGFGFERRKLPKVDSLADPNKASVEANKSLMISEEEAMLQEMFETYNVEFRDTDMVDFLKEKLSHLEAENVEDIFGSERRVQDCVDKMEVASSTLDDLRCYMDSIHVKLQHMRKDIRAIDMQNYVFNIQRRNNKSMLDELEKIFDKGEVRQEVITALEKGTLSRQTGTTHSMRLRRSRKPSSTSTPKSPNSRRREESKTCHRSSRHSARALLIAPYRHSAQPSEPLSTSTERASAIARITRCIAASSFTRLWSRSSVDWIAVSASAPVVPFVRKCTHSS